MRWQEKLSRILRWPTAVSGLTMASLIANAAVSDQDAIDAAEPEVDGVVLPNTLNADADDLYAQHQSHRSHSSHGSHRSSSGSRRAVPKPIPESERRRQPVEETRRESRPVDKALPKPTSEDVSRMVVRTQAALMRKGYYEGDIDGVLGDETRAALKAFQKDEKIKETGRMDIETLTRLGISIP